MVGAHDAVVEIGDTWEDGLAKYQVESVDYASAYQVGALVTGFLKLTPDGMRIPSNRFPFTLPVTWRT